MTSGPISTATGSMAGKAIAYIDGQNVFRRPVRCGGSRSRPRPGGRVHRIRGRPAGRGGARRRRQPRAPPAIRAPSASAASFAQDDRRVDPDHAGDGGKAAVGAGDHPVAADDRGVAPDPLCDEARMLDEVVGRIDDAGNEDRVVGDRGVLPVPPLVVVARVGSLEEDRLRPSPEQGIENLRDRDVVRVRAGIVAPADVYAHRLARDIGGRGVERLDIAFDDPEEPCVRQVPVADVPGPSRGRGNRSGG